jgi:hypothetical protein
VWAVVDVACSMSPVSRDRACKVFWAQFRHRPKSGWGDFRHLLASWHARDPAICEAIDRFHIHYHTQQPESSQLSTLSQSIPQAEDIEPISRPSQPSVVLSSGDGLDLRCPIRWGRRTEALLLPQRNITAMHERNKI